MAVNASQKALGARLARIRRAARLTQEDAAAQAGVATETLSRIERGTRPLKVETLQKLADTYGVDIAEVFQSAKGHSEKDLLIENLAALMQRQSPSKLTKAAQLLYVLFDEDPPSPLRVKKRK